MKVIAPVVGSTVQTPSPGTVRVLPSSLRVLPLGGFTILTVLLSMLPSASLSFASTLMVTGCALPVELNVPIAVSELATGACSVELELPPPPPPPAAAPSAPAPNKNGHHATCSCNSPRL